MKIVRLIFLTFLGIFSLGLFCAIFEPIFAKKIHYLSMEHLFPINHDLTYKGMTYNEMANILTNHFTIGDAFSHFGQPKRKRYIYGHDVFLFSAPMNREKSALGMNMVSSFVLVFSNFTLTAWSPLSVDGIQIRYEHGEWTSDGIQLNGEIRWPGFGKISLGPSVLTLGDRPLDSDKREEK